ncbi:PAS domain-containing methyl-accepting chemotaxis protein [Vibrio sp. ABG19]|uniref:methyl-accepting chemotaxis protein n=1 Tax=Vibrio sp. ABG19 TaxID=2817385 RepID=UPI00249EFF72|nr:PAS domain-containing methyl-accepting chemotaxis protein [Vibrio sp. ABG19]WGY46829.1 PAS domain-containing methyl-accepting chemotaxis protein [Vibrio sp. ABG19]
MFFNKSLQLENQRLREALYSLEQVRDSLDEDMMRISLDANGVVTSVNHRLQTELGLAAEKLVGKPLVELVPKKARTTQHFNRMKAAIETKEHWNGALQIEKNNGDDAWIRVILQPILNSKGKLESFILYGSELTRTIKTSREHEDMLKALNRSTAVIEFSLDGTILRANENFLRTMGYRNNEQIAGKHHRIFCDSAEVNSPAYKEFWRKLATGQFVSDRFKRIDSHGQDVWLEASYNPIHNSEGELYKVVKFATVITELVNQEIAVSQAAKIAFDVSEITGQQTAQGQQVVSTTIAKMDALVAQMKQASAGIEALNEQSKRIDDLVASISGIADQTNLLALNAAIEAARAGEQGRGFAVVADEVRQLASRTNSTTEEISTVVTENLKRTRNAVELIAACQSQAAETLELSTEAGQVMEDIQRGSQRVVDAVSQFNQKL